MEDINTPPKRSRLAEEGQYEVDGLLGYLAGIPTYSLLAERVVTRVLRGVLQPAGRRLGQPGGERS